MGRRSRESAQPFNALDSLADARDFRSDATLNLSIESVGTTSFSFNPRDTQIGGTITRVCTQYLEFIDQIVDTTCR